MAKSRPSANASSRKPKPKAKAIKRLTHAERYARREAMAKKVKSGASVESVARENKVTTVWVVAACKQFGVEPKGA